MSAEVFHMSTATREEIESHRYEDAAGPVERVGDELVEAGTISENTRGSPLGFLADPSAADYKHG